MTRQLKAAEDLPGAELETAIAVLATATRPAKPSIRRASSDGSAPVRYNAPEGRNPLTTIEGLRDFYGAVIPAVVLNDTLSVTGGNAIIAATAIAHVADVLEQMAPRDPLERMLIQQTLVTHARIATLSQEVGLQRDPEMYRIMSESLDRASNVFRRQMLAFQIYRGGQPQAPEKPMKQTNIAGQMVVQNFLSKEEDSSNGTGNEAVPALSERPAIEARADQVPPALAAIDGAKNGRRKKTVKSKRAQARATVRGVARG
jgi:hypothetical protein